MAKEILLYNTVHDYSAERFITELEANKDEDIVLRINTNGGSPESGFGMIAKWAELTGKKTVKVDGKAHSFGAFFLCYTDDSECLDVSEMVVHRAAYSKWFEESDYMTTELWDNLNRMNTSLRKALEAKIDVEKFEKLKGVTLDDVFSNDTRIDVYLTATEAKKIGLVNRINKITPAKKAEINSRMMAIAAEYNGFEIEANKELKSKPVHKMTLDELQAESPALYNQIFAAGKAAGVEAEKDRVGAWMAFQDVDAEAVKAGIDSGKVPSAKDMAELSRKAFSADALKDLEKGSVGSVSTEETTVAKTEKEKSLEASEDKLFGALGLKK